MSPIHQDPDWICANTVFEQRTDLLFVPDGGDVSQNAVHLLLRRALADVVLDQAAQRRPDGANVVLAQVVLFISVFPEVCRRR